MAKNHTARKQLCGSVQNSTNNMTTGKSIKANASRSTATATLALLDIVNWTRSYHKVHWKQLILVDTFRLNFSKNHWGKKMLCLTPFQKFGNHLEPKKSACRNWYWSFIANEGMQSHLEVSPNYVAWTHKKSWWPIKDKATGDMRHRRREKLKDVTFGVRHIFSEMETIGLETRTGFIFHPFHKYFLWKVQKFLFKSAINRKGELKSRFEKRTCTRSRSFK